MWPPTTSETPDVLGKDPIGAPEASTGLVPDAVDFMKCLPDRLEVKTGLSHERGRLPSQESRRLGSVNQQSSATVESFGRL